MPAALRRTSGTFTRGSCDLIVKFAQLAEAVSALRAAATKNPSRWKYVKLGDSEEIREEVHVSSEMPKQLLNMKFDDWKRRMKAKAKSGTLSEREVIGCRSLCH